MFTDIKEHMLLSKAHRQLHLDLTAPCWTIGGKAGEHRGFLSAYLKVTLPRDRIGILCHACHNGQCSNPKHLYWGTDSENLQDQYEGNERHRSISYYGIKKHGEEKWREIKSMVGSLGGKAKRKNLEQLEELYKTEVILPFAKALEGVDTSKRGWVKIMCNKMNMSHTHIRRMMLKHFPERLPK